MRLSSMEKAVIRHLIRDPHGVLSGIVWSAAGERLYGVAWPGAAGLSDIPIDNKLVWRRQDHLEAVAARCRRRLPDA